jgi:DNA polymerase-3 subunit delta'
MAWINIIGHKPAIDFLIKSFEKNRLYQSLLFLGPEAIGKKLVALEFAKFLLCENKLNFNACDKCPNCLKCLNLTHPDLHLLSKDNLDWIKIDEVRQLQEVMRLRPFSSKVKIAIIDNAHMLTDEAANSLLKFIEEPSPQSLLILISNRFDSLFQTIVSRCQRLYFSSLSHQETEQALTELKPENQKDVKILAKFCEGRLGQALLLSEPGTMFSERNQLLHNLLNKTNTDFSDFTLSLDKQNIQIMLESVLVFFRDMLLFKTGVDKDFLINSADFNTLKSVSQRIELVDIELAIADILKAQELNRNNVNYKILLTWLFDSLRKNLR